MRPPRWFLRELKLINPSFNVKWLPRIGRWVIMEDERLSHHIQNEDKSFRPLDQRILRKLRVDTFFTKNRKALTEFLNDDPYGLIAYTARGMMGIEDYLMGD